MQQRIIVNMSQPRNRRMCYNGIARSHELEIGMQHADKDPRPDVLRTSKDTGKGSPKIFQFPKSGFGKPFV